MSRRRHTPGVSRPDRLSDEGLARLQAQLEAGIAISTVVLEQWIKRYGAPAREIIEKYKDRHSNLD